MRPGKGFTTSQSNEHLRVFSDKDRAKKAQWNYDPSREHLNFEFRNGLKAQKLLAEGSALGTLAVSNAPCNKGKSFV